MTFRRVLVLAVFFLTVGVFAQTPTGQISGMVVDGTSSALPGVTVTGRNQDTGLTRSSVSNTEGQYALPLLPAGTYEVSAELEGFQAFRRSNIVVNVGSDVTVRIPLRIGVQETITVSAEAPVVETTRSSVASTVNETMIENLPVNGRNFIDFALTTPGVVRDNMRQGDINFAGLRGTANSLVVDGADNNNTFFGQSLGRTGDRNSYQFSQDAVKEFQINTNAYSAEYGRASGAVINVVTKSGTNNFDGTAFFFYRDRDLREKTFLEELNNVRKGPYQWDQYGGSFGGPIVPDRHFFFVNYDAQRNEVPVTITLPGNLPTDAASQAGLAKIQPLIFNYAQGRNQDIYLIKTDHEMWKSHLSLRYNRQDFTGKSNESTLGVFEHSGDSLRKVDTLALNLAMPINNSVFNEVRAQYAKDEEPGSANSPNPEASIRQGGQQITFIGRNFFSPRETTIKRWQLADTAMFLLGNHTFRAGFDILNDEIFNFFPGNFSGSYVFQSLASFNSGRPSGSGERYVQAFPGPGTTGPITNPDQFETALFLQDEWQVRPNLTLNAGLRYDFQDVEQPSVRNPDPQLAAAGIDTGQIPTDDNNIAPRLGITWAPGFSQRSVVRAGYGVFYGRTPAIMVGTAHSNNGINVQTITFTGEQVPTYPNTFASLPSGAAIPRPTIFAFDEDYENPMVHQASLGFEHALSDMVAVGLSYLYVRGDDLTRSIDINVGAPVVENIALAAGGTLPVRRYPTNTRPFSNFARIIEFQSSANSEYNGVTLDINKRFGQNWQGRVSYTFSDTKDDKPDATAVVPASSDDAKFAQDPTDFDLEWGTADMDVEHRLVLSGVWNLDYGRDLGAWWQKMILEGWSLSGIVTWHTGYPFSAEVSADLNNDQNTRNDRAPEFERNSFRFEDYLSIDPRIAKSFSLGGGIGLQLIAEAFNVTNESNILDIRKPFYTLNSSGQLVRTTNFAQPLTSLFYETPRTIQLAAKLTF
jgi:outer membrane receptor protein involved in Fe transport